jgi:amphi-Trp domain-containing protein
MFPADVRVHVPEEVLFEVESDMTRGDIASILRDTADKLDGGGEITIDAGGDSISVNPPGTTEFEVKVERETKTGQTEGELSIEFELEWDERHSGTDGTDGSLSVE